MASIGYRWAIYVCVYVGDAGMIVELEPKSRSNLCCDLTKYGQRSPRIAQVDKVFDSRDLPRKFWR